MTVSTANAVLRQGIVDWRDSFMGVTSWQNAGDVRSSLQDICIDARVGTEVLPSSLQALYTEASDRAWRQGRGGYPNPFDAGDLIRIANEALGQL